MLAPDVTNTDAGKELVDIMANGVLAYMKTHDIPRTREGFAIVTQHAREKGLNGKIAFLDPNAMVRVRALIAQHSGLSFLILDEKTIDGNKPQHPSIRKRFEQWHLTPEDTTLPAETKDHYLRHLRESVGEDAFSILEASRFGDCQRRLVWERMMEIISQ